MNTQPQTPDGTGTNAMTVNLLDALRGGGPRSATLELVKLGDNETAIIPFTASGEPIDLHYCPETDLGGYVPCNGTDCTLCRIGRKRESRTLLPVYLPTAGTIGVLPVSPSLRPHSLLPQLAPALQADRPKVLFVSREGGQYRTTMSELGDAVDGGETVIASFLENHRTGGVILSSVYHRVGNAQLAAVPEIARMLALKEGRS